MKIRQIGDLGPIYAIAKVGVLDAKTSVYTDQWLPMQPLIGVIISVGISAPVMGAPSIAMPPHRGVPLMVQT
jgi:hypothetical protein